MAKVALITGGGSGIGRACARALAGAGFSVAVFGRNKPSLEETVAGIDQARRLTVVADVGRPAQVLPAVEAVVRNFGRLDLVVNNAAFIARGKLVDIDFDDISQTISTNLLGPLLVSQAAVPHLSASRGQIVNIGSIAGIRVSRISSVYGMSKAALHHLTTCLAHELAPEGIRVNAIVPGPVEKTHQAEPAREQHRQMHTLIGRLGKPAEIAEWVCLIASERSAWMTGSILVIDGGAAIT